MARHNNVQSSNDSPSDKREDDNLKNSNSKIDDGINFKTSLKVVNIKEEKVPARKGADDVSNIFTKTKPINNGWVGANFRGSSTVAEFSNILNPSNSPQVTPINYSLFSACVDLKY